MNAREKGGPSEMFDEDEDADEDISDTDTEAQVCDSCTEDTCVEKGGPDMPPCGDDEEEER